MQTSKVAVAGGLLILAGGIALALYTGMNGPVLEATKAKAVQRYAAMVDKSMAKGDLRQAEKYAKEALVVDPKNKTALAEYKKVILASCPKAAPAATSAAPAEAAKGTQSAAPAAAPAAKPAAPAADSEEDMGCI